MNRRSALTGSAFLLAIGSLPYKLYAAESQAFDIIPYIDPELRPVLKWLREREVGQVYTDADLPQFRSSRRIMGLDTLPEPTWRKQSIPGPADNRALQVLIINEKQGTSARPAILHIHGGGFISGGIDRGLPRLQRMAADLDAVIVSVDYRLAPETRFPGALHDNTAALRWVHANAGMLNIDRSRIAVMGESAGGGHAAMLVNAVRADANLPICFQLLVAPMLDDRTGSTVSKPRQMGAILWSPEMNRFGWTSLLGVQAGSDRVPPGSVPSRETDLSGLPPTFIGVGSLDLFLDEDVDYARRLADAGVAVELMVLPRAFHALENAIDTKIGQRFNAAILAALKNGLAAKPSV